MSTRTDLCRNKKYEKGRFINFLIPAVLAILLHLSLLIFTKKSNLSQTQIEPPKRVMILPVSSTLPSEKKMMAWLNILDPSYFIRPDRVHGFSRTLPSDKCEDIPFKLEKHIEWYKYGNMSPLPLPWQSVEAKVERLWRHIPLTVHSLPLEKYKINAQYPVWMLENSQLLPQLFTKDDNILQYIKENPPLHNETVLKVKFFGPNLYPEVNVVESSGTPKLDKLAIRILSVRGKIFAINDTNSKSYYFIVVKWK